MIILDFDGVLFNDERFKRDFWRLFRRFGIPHRVHQAAYRETRTQCGGYRHEVHLRLIRCAMPSVDIIKLDRAIMRLLAQARQYIYREARTFLAYYKKRGEHLMLASNGYAFQKKKVASSGIIPLFSAAVVRDVPKSKIIRGFIRRFRPQRIVFIDDKKSVVEEVKRNIPQATVLQMVRRKGQERSTRADAVVSSLAAARRIIERRKSSFPQPRGAREH